MGNRTPSKNRSGFDSFVVELGCQLVELSDFFPVVGEGLLAGELRTVGAVEITLATPAFNGVLRGGWHKLCFLFH